MDTRKIPSPQSATQRALAKIERVIFRHGLIKGAYVIASDDSTSHHKYLARNRKWLEWYIKYDLQGEELFAVCDLQFQAQGARQETSIGIAFYPKDDRWKIWRSIPDALGMMWMQRLTECLYPEERESNILQPAQAIRILHTLIWCFRNPLF